MTLSEFRKWVLPPMAVLMLVLTALAFAPFYRASRHMDGFCQGLARGLALDDIRARAAAAGYDMDEPAQGGTLVRDPRSFGRLQCTLRLDERGHLASASAGD